MDTLRDVKIFHEVFNHPVAETPILMNKERLLTRIGWIKDELQELEDALNAGDIKEVADALADAQYFLSGTIIECGMADIFPKVFEEVQRSNMSKACKTREEANATVIQYEKEGVNCGYLGKTDPITGEEFFIIIRQPDGKTLKAKNWSEPDLSFVKES